MVPKSCKTTCPCRPRENVHYVYVEHSGSVTRLGDLLDFGQLFKADGNNYFAQITHI